MPKLTQLQKVRRNSRLPMNRHYHARHPKSRGPARMDTEAQIAFVLKQAEDGTPIGEVCRKAGISDAMSKPSVQAQHRQSQDDPEGGGKTTLTIFPSTGPVLQGIVNAA